MKKKLNIEQVTNELRGGSAFFPSYKNAQNDQVSEKMNVSPTSSHQEPIQPKGEIQQHQTNSQIHERSNAPTPARPNVRRIITRNSFETYEDQMESLRKLSYKEKMEGQIGSMSKMVRDAIDDYLKKRSSGL